MKLRHVGVMSAAKIGAVLGLIIGFISGLVMTIIALSLGSLLAGLQQAGAVLPGAGLALFGFGALAVITMPLAGVILGFIMGAVHAFLYNVAAKYVGGLELNLK